jgi:hypothetical protein
VQFISSINNLIYQHNGTHSYFQKLWDDYRLINPSVDKIHHLLNERGEHIINDHIALRTYDVAGINIEALAETFLAAGYVEKGFV